MVQEPKESEKDPKQTPKMITSSKFKEPTPKKDPNLKPKQEPFQTWSPHRIDQMHSFLQVKYKICYD